MDDNTTRLKIELAKSKEYLDINDVVLLSGFSSATIHRRILEGKLKAFQQVPKGKLLFKSSNVIKWLERGIK